MIKKRTKIALIILLVMVLAAAGAFYMYVSDYYRADDVARSVLQNNPNLQSHDNLIILSPDQPNDTALVFYPGGKVDAVAYLPILEQIRQNCGITCILVKMPFNLAVFDANAADGIINQFPDIKHWYIGGLSLGGAMASNYAARHAEKLDGLILLGAYIYGDYPAADTLTIYGTLNTAVAEKINYTQNVLAIDGGNHAQFGNYGPQKGDRPALISADEQQNAAVAAIKQFLAQRVK